MDAPKITVQRARHLRVQMTLPEVLLWQVLRGKRLSGYRFRRQHPFGPYVLDFYCDAAKLAVEVDGDDHRRRAETDALRDAWLASQGVRTLRIPAVEILKDLPAVTDWILREVMGE